MDDEQRLRLHDKVQQLRALAERLSDESIRVAIEQAAQEIEQFDDETAQLFLSRDHSNLLWLADSGTAQLPGRRRAQ